MRIIVSFNGGGLTLNFENIEKIIDYGSYITLVGNPLTIVVNAGDICSCEVVNIQKSWLLTVSEVYFDTRIKEVE